MKNGRKKSLKTQLVIVLLSMILVSTTAIGFSKLSDGPEITITTDQPQYYPGEYVTVSGHLRNSENQPASSSPVCIAVNDSQQNSIFGTCTLTNGAGDYAVSFPLEETAVLGVYAADVHSVEFDIRAETTFEVVTTAVTAVASGSCTGVAGIPVNFFGSATGGKQPYTWYWDFGDQQTSPEQNPSHTYTATGGYTVVLTVTDKDGHSGNDSLVITIIPGENNPPSDPTISGPATGKPKVELKYNVSTTDLDGDQVYYWIEWCKNCSDANWIGPYNSSETISVKHTWETKGDYTIRLKAKDTHGAESNWTTLEVSMPKDVHFFQGFFYRFIRMVFPRIFGNF
jgi:hypothetical protein